MGEPGQRITLRFDSGNVLERIIALYNSVFKTYIKPELQQMITYNLYVGSALMSIQLPILALLYIVNSNLFYIFYLLSVLEINKSSASSKKTGVPPLQPGGKKVITKKQPETTSRPPTPPSPPRTPAIPSTPLTTIVESDPASDPANWRDEYGNLLVPPPAPEP
jgi:hypothetical protein